MVFDYDLLHDPKIFYFIKYLVKYFVKYVIM